jgi:cytochrome c-type biogenesis protein CcmH/NrfG
VLLKAWLVEQTLSGGAALGILAAIFVAFVAIWTSQGSAWVFLWIATLVGGCAALPMLGAYGNKRALRQMAEDRIAQYLGAIGFDPKNAAAHAYLADAYMECGRVDDAIAAYETAIALSPEHSHQERAKLRRAREAKQGDARF